MADVRLATAPEVVEYRNPATEQKFTQMVRDAIAAGHILATWKDVTVAEKTSPTGKELTVNYIRCEALSIQGMAALSGGKIPPATSRPEKGDDTRTDAEKATGACDYHNYGFDLQARAPLRVHLLDEVKGPEAAVKVAVKGCIAAGFDPEMVKGSPKFKDYPGIAAMVDRILASL